MLASFQAGLVWPPPNRRTYSDIDRDVVGRFFYYLHQLKLLDETRIGIVYEFHAAVNGWTITASTGNAF